MASRRPRRRQSQAQPGVPIASIALDPTGLGHATRVFQRLLVCPNEEQPRVGASGVPRNAVAELPGIWVSDRSKSVIEGWITIYVATRTAKPGPAQTCEEGHKWDGECPVQTTT